MVDDTHHFVFIADLVLCRMLMVLHSFHFVGSDMCCHSLMKYLWLWWFNLLHHLLLFHRLRQMFITFIIFVHKCLQLGFSFFEHSRNIFANISTGLFISDQSIFEALNLFGQVVSDTVNTCFTQSLELTKSPECLLKTFFLSL